ncbi:MAG TPA: ABC transporter substrate-binding protein [Acetobacteraceae bacterium]|nr:ABC transporter substrate-binding protein [Acetobacteraceae bacterium]
MQRRTFLAAGTASLALTAVSHAADKRVLKFIPQSDLAVLDPIWTTAYVTRNHGFMIFDTLYGQAGKKYGFKATPQMVAGHAIENSGKTWKLTLRDGLMFHDGTKVLARDCVASIKRWAARDAFGQGLMQRTDEVAAPNDNTILFRLKQSFALLPDALGHAASNMCAIMPERLANTDPYKQITEMVGSGPYRFNAKERVSGSLYVYERFENYKPLTSGEASFTSGPKIAHFDRIEWHVTPDPSTAAGALQSGEMDWWENPTADLLPLLKRFHIKTEISDPTGTAMMLRPNHLYPPFDNPEIRRALWGAIDQAEFMTAMMGTDKTLWEVPAGFFPPISPMSSDAGMTVLTSKRDDAAVKQALVKAGYKGEKIALMVATDYPILKAIGDVSADMLKRVGFNVDYQATDWGTVVQRRSSMKPPSEGGWNVFNTGFSGLDFFTPAADLPLRGNGKKAWFGWPTMPKIEELRTAWFGAPDLAAQKKICTVIQLQAFQDVPYWPVGLAHLPTAYRPDIAGVPEGFPLFWNVHRT